MAAMVSYKTTDGDSSVIEEQHLRKRPRYITAPINDSGHLWKGNFIALEQMSLIVSRDPKWKGHSIPFDVHVKHLRAFVTRPGNTLCDTSGIEAWLRSHALKWDPLNEKLLLLTPDDLYGTDLREDVDQLIPVIMLQHAANQSTIKLKIEPLRSTSPRQPVLSASEPTPPVEGIAQGPLNLKDLFSVFEGLTGPPVPKCREVVIPPPVADDIKLAETLMARWSTPQYNEARVFFRLPTVEIMVAELVKVKWIRKCLWPHQIMFMYQAVQLFVNYGSMFNADEQGLGKTLETVTQVWLNKLVDYMDMSIDMSRGAKDVIPTDEQGSPKLHRHLPADAEVGSRCPSTDLWPVTCRCEPGSPTMVIPSSRRPSVVYCNVIRTIPAWAQEVDEFCDEDCPFQLKAVICSANQDNSTGSTRVIEGSKRPASSYQSTVPKRALQYGFGRCYANRSASHYVLVTNTASADKHMFALLDDRVSFHMIAVDESHEVTGENSHFVKNQIRPHMCNLEDITRFEDGTLLECDRQPTFFMFVSGTPWKDITDLKPFWPVIVRQISAIRAIWKSEGEKSLLDKTEADHKRISEFEFSIEKKKELKRKAKLPKWDNEDLKAHGAEIGACMAMITIRRTNSTRMPEAFPFNTPIICLPPLKDVRIEVDYSTAQRAACNNFVSALKKTLVSDAGSKKTSSIRELNRSFSKQVETGQALASLPSLDGLLADGSFEEWASSNNQIKFTKVNMDIVGYNNKSHQLRKDVATSCETDPKISKVVDIIKGVMRNDAEDMRKAEASKKRSPKQFIGEPSDHLQKVVVVSQSLLTTLTTYDILEKKFPEMDIGLITGWLDARNSATVFEAFQDEMCNDKSAFKHLTRPRLLIATVRNMSTGVNLHRANHLIIMEPSANPSQDLQLASREHRIGQKRSCFIYRLMGKDLEIEQLVTNRKKKRLWLISAALAMDLDVPDEDELSSDEDEMLGVIGVAR
ncbi:hypothetical protein EK21DRAFT_119153 [Setomelanomma holmii]|uniref:Helicase C-terminal domain-containing protein n=1 Tax=Setomelanomma holmii TaxID=210430 RepID=A0A9P4GU81_9PLEO|nr:hypothetical protein EK21DRAFT_119153 [Setomelanomma holmii]